MAAAGALLIATLAAGCSAATSSVPNPATLDEGRTYAPLIDPANFSQPLANDYFPLDPGLVTVFEGSGEHVEVTVTADTKVIMGVATRVITDQVTVYGELQEDTIDWYAADNFGNVWYFGEQDRRIREGPDLVDRGILGGGYPRRPAGDFPAVNRASATHIARSSRRPGSSVARVYAVEESITVPKDTYDLVLVTEDWSLLAPNVHERKWYAPRVGVVFEETVQGGSGTLSLIDAVRR